MGARLEAILQSVLGWDHQFCHSGREQDHDPKAYLSDISCVDLLTQAFLSFGPPLYLLLGLLVRVRQLRNANPVGISSLNGEPFKKAIALLVLAFEITALRSHGHLEATTPVATSLSSLASPVALLVLLLLESKHDFGLSCLLTGHLVLSIFRDLLQVSPLNAREPPCTAHSILPASIVTRSVLLILETRSRNHTLQRPQNNSSPEDTSGYLNVFFFWWVNGFLRTGHSKSLSLEDMPPMPRSLDATNMREALQREWSNREASAGRFALMKAQLRCLQRLNILSAFPNALLVLLRCSQPFLIRRAIAFFNQNSSGFEARNEAFRLLLMTFTLYSGIAICNGVSKRLLGQINSNTRMSLVGLLFSHCLKTADHSSADSAVLTLVSSDTDSAANLGTVFHDTWSQVLEFAVGTYLLSAELGWVCIVPSLVVLLISQTVKAVTEDLGTWHMAYSKATQSRITATKATLDAMKNVKMMGVVENMENHIRGARVFEMKQYILLYRLLIAFFVSGVGLHLFSPAITLVVYAIQAHLRDTASLDVTKAFTSIAIINVVTSPANTLLTVLPEAMSVISAFERIQEYLLKPIREDKRLAISDLDNHSNLDDQKTPESNKRQLLVAVRVDNATIRLAGAPDPILRDINTVWKRRGFIVIAGAVGTGKTTLAKALLGDLLPEVGTVQTAHKLVSYCSQTAWLTNTTIRGAIRGSSVPVDISEDKWYQRVLHACALEEDLRRMPQGDQTLVGSRGASLSGGQKQRIALARALYARNGLAILDDVVSALDSVTENHIINYVLGPNGLFKELGTTVVAITHSTKYLPLADHVVILNEKGRIAEQGRWDELRTTSDIASQFDKEPRDHVSEDACSSGDQNSPGLVQPSESFPQHDRSTHDNIDVYAYYVGAIGLKNFFLLTGSLLVYATTAAVVPYCLQWMVKNDGPYTWLPMVAYLALTIATFASVSTAVALVFLVIAPKAGNVIHTELLHTVMYAPLSYFTETATGTTLNYFSSDLSTIDRSLPFSLFQTCQAVFRLLAQAMLLGTLQPIITITMPLTVIAVYLVQKFYLATSRQLQSLSLQAQASVQEGFLETLEGVATIRAFGWEEQFLQSATRRLDISSRPEYMLVIIQGWLDLVLDLLVMGLAVSVIGLGVALKGTATGGQIGIALNVVLQLNNYILRLVEAWAKLETSAAAVSRLRTFERQVQSEESTSVKDAPTLTWPAQGSIELSHVSAWYGTSVRALNDVTFSIAPGTKVGIVGRTGSGKSSLLLTLLRLLDVQSPSVMRIDSIDLLNVPRNTTRSRLITVPQDPMLFGEDSLRQNLDLSGSISSNDELVKVLERVGLWDLLRTRAIDEAASRSDYSDDSEGDIAELDDQRNTRGPDEIGVSDESQLISREQVFDVRMKRLPLSQGQQQLFSLGRALLMRSNRGRVVLLDEATSNVDLATEKLMRQVIKEEFETYTVSTIAHQLDTIMGCDVVLVLDSGRLVEAGPPAELEKKEGGAFRELVHGGR